MKTIAIAAALAALAAPAFADEVWTATPAQPSVKTNILAAGVLWDCDAAGCHSTSDTSSADAVASCRELVQEVGSVSAFNDPKPFTDARLQHCNAGAKKPS